MSHAVWPRFLFSATAWLYAIDLNRGASCQNIHSSSNQLSCKSARTADSRECKWLRWFSKNQFNRKIWNFYFKMSISNHSWNTFSVVFPYRILWFIQGVNMKKVCISFWNFSKFKLNTEIGFQEGIAGLVNKTVNIFVISDKP